MSAKKQKEYIVKRILACAIIAAAVLFIFIVPGYYDDQLDKDEYRIWLDNDTDKNVGIIKVWHVVGIRPFSGSLGSLLYSEAKAYAKRSGNVYFEVKSYTEEEAAEQLRRGNCPDIISFPKGFLKGEDLIAINGEVEGLFGICRYSNECRAVPYCASGSLILFTTDRSDAKTDELIEGAGSAPEFKAGKKRSCITDIKGAGDLYRAQLNGKCPYFDAAPFPKGRFEAQYIGLYNSIEPKKVSEARGFISLLLEEKAQKKISELGLLPVIKDSDTAYEFGWLTELYHSFDPGNIDNCF